MDFKELLHSPSTWFFGVAVAAVLGVWWARVTPMTTNISLAFAVLALMVAVFFQPWIQTQHLVLRIVWALSAGCVTFLLAYYTLWVDLSKAVLSPAAFASSAEQPKNTVIGGVQWDKKFSELRIAIENSTKWDFANLDITIVPDEPVVSAEARNDLDETVSLARTGPLLLHSTELVLPDGSRRRIDLIPVASDHGYRLRAPKMAAQSHIIIRMAIAGMAEFPKVGSLPPQPNLGLDRQDYVQRMTTKENGRSTWFGHSDRPSKVFVRKIAKRIKITGGFEVQNTAREVDFDIPTLTTP